MKNLVLFNPSIEGGGVEKNLEMIINHFSKHINSKVYLISCDKILDTNSKINYIKPIINVRTRNRFFKYLICLISLIKFYFKDKKFVILSFQANVYAIILAKILRQKIIVRANSAPSKWINIYKIPILRFFYKLADKVIVNSFNFKKEIDRKFKIKSFVIYNPLNSKKILKLSKVRKKFPFFDNYKKSIKLINVGRLTYQKNQIDLLKIINKLKNKIPIKLLIIGNGSKDIILQKYINKFGLKSHVKIMGFNKNPYIYLLKSDIFILTSLYEGLPNVLLEATLLKKLCISYNCKTGPSEILLNGNGGILVNEGDFEKIIHEIQIFYKNQKSNNYKRMISISYKNSNKYDYQNQLKKYEKLILNYLK